MRWSCCATEKEGWNNFSAVPLRYVHWLLAKQNFLNGLSERIVSQPSMRFRNPSEGILSTKRWSNFSWSCKIFILCRASVSEQDFLKIA
ncbi:hypothetical protein TNIN_20551 [Trichonephila inaurata madagascariensis]|uniref:Uncharacterized protein n=1 Tax=Trichonephila inaurata madagascariensis TaxID=2747483 RepID=A0A8X6YNS3_9ARAC|nr:hypothetical protein TNIN_20551 [Trichonephila inaurata madagascariensis]